MFVTKINILHRALKTLEIDIKGRQHLLAHGIDWLGTLIHYKYNIWQSLVNMEHSKFLIAELYQIFVLPKWRHTTFIRIPTTTEDDLY